MFQPRLSLAQTRERSIRREQLSSEFDNKLLCELIFAIDFDLCVRFRCSTCGGFEFYENVFRCVTGSAESFEGDNSFRRRLWSTEIQEKILVALAEVSPPAELSAALHEPARFLLQHAINTIGHVTHFEDLGDDFADRIVRSITQHTWAGTVLDKIYEHEERKSVLRQQKKQQELERGNRAAARRAEHQTIRSHLKAERDRIYREEGRVPTGRNKLNK